MLFLLSFHMNPTSSEDLRKIPVSWQRVTQSPESKPDFSVAHFPNASVSLTALVAEVLISVMVWGEKRKWNWDFAFSIQVSVTSVCAQRQFKQMQFNRKIPRVYMFVSCDLNVKAVYQSQRYSCQGRLAFVVWLELTRRGSGKTDLTFQVRPNRSHPRTGGSRLNDVCRLQGLLRRLNFVLLLSEVQNHIGEFSYIRVF